MIKVLDKTFVISTNKTSYLFMIDKSSHLKHLYYGSYLSDVDEKSLEALKNKLLTPIANAIEYNDDNKDFLNEVSWEEAPTRGKGDLRNPMIEIENKDKNRTSDFTYVSYEIKEIEGYKSLPSARNTKESLIIHLKDQENKVEMDLIYTSFDTENVISRKTLITNRNEENIKLIRAFSLSLDFKGDDYFFRSFHGHWGKEMNIYDQKIVIGSLISESLAGVSSSRANPFVMIYRAGANEDYGEAYGFNLIYSGNHQESVEIDSFKNIRFLTGINPTTFNYTLKKDETFEVPEAIMSYSKEGFNALSSNFHSFIKEHIIDPNFSHKIKPVLNNSWEACYFNFDEKKLLKMAKCAKALGVELFVLDDGWFGRRTDDTKGLGDWTENKAKLPHGLKGLAERINKIGLDFGIWVEPEMLNENSLLYETHPEWAIRIKDHPHSVGRHQMILDLSNRDVEDYLYDAMCYVFKESKAKYIKWDMNRVFSDYYSQTLDKDKMMELSHRYYLGLYSLLKRLKETFKDILFESCASGGNRYDLGMLYYMPQTWASDNTDPFVRMKMQMAYSYGYPYITMGSHVASSPTLTTLRRSSIETRFNVAMFGAFGYEIDLRKESKQDKKKIKNQILIYKKYREKMIDSSTYRLKAKDDKYQSMLVSKDKTLAIVVYTKEINHPIDAYENIKLKGLDPSAMYHVFSDDIYHSIKELGEAVNHISPIYIKDGGIVQNIISKIIKLKENREDSLIKGDILMEKGLTLNENFSGCGYHEGISLIKDFSSRIYYLEKIE